MVDDESEVNGIHQPYTSVSLSSAQLIDTESGIQFPFPAL
jgi:hypothetical protein